MAHTYQVADMAGRGQHHILAHHVLSTIELAGSLAPEEFNCPCVCCFVQTASRNVTIR